MRVALAPPKGKSHYNSDCTTVGDHEGVISRVAESTSGLRSGFRAHNDAEGCLEISNGAQGATGRCVSWILEFHEGGVSGRGVVRLRR